MDYSTLQFESRNYIGYLTLNRPQQLNSLSIKMREELFDFFTNVGDDPDVRVIIMTGSGERAFCAGADIKEGEFSQTINESRRFRTKINFHSAIENAPQPVIAAINGYALGGGLEIALACDIRIAVDSAQVGLPEVTLGRIPGAGGTQRLPRVVGRGKALELILTGERIPADEAYRIGLVSKVVSREELIPAAEKMANAILMRAPLAVRYAKESIIRGLELPLDDALRQETFFSALLLASEDRREGERAFVEKRPPQFTGR
ncbi:MAG: enoyl-CoA hydratase/isomerase family protein [Chloroflexi bacterium]|nr:enoyl-CoA hydratase/isomerase family protein [Chloroflexota bacterium]